MASKPRSLRRGLCVVEECTPKMMLTKSTLHTCTSITRIQREPILITEDNRTPVTLQLTLSRHQTSCASQCCGSLARVTCDVSASASRRFPMVRGVTTGSTCAEFLTWMVLGRPPLLVQCIDLHVRLYCAAVQNLVYMSGNVQ